MDCAARQAPQKEAVNRSASELAALRSLTRSGDMIEDPGDLGRGEIGIEQEPGPRSDQRLGTLSLQACTFVGGSAVLPDDRAVHRLTRCPFPDDDRLALVRDSDARHPTRIDRGQGVARYSKRILPDLLRIV